MTKSEALQIPDLCIEVTPLVEDLFYCILTEAGELSTEAGDKSAQRVKDLCMKSQETPELLQSFALADKMHKNLQKYGVACAEWCE